MATATDTAPPVNPTPPSNQKRSKSPSSYRKPCDICYTPSNVLVRCRVDVTLKWYFVCTSKCWKQVSGGEIDGPDRPYYTYGGMWKNKHAGVSAKKPKQKQKAIIREWTASGVKYVRNDKVMYGAKLWHCRMSHGSAETRAPGQVYALWKEGDNSSRNGGKTAAEGRSPSSSGAVAAVEET